MLTSRLVAVLTVLAITTGLFFSWYRLSEAPGIWYDEGFYTQTAMNLAERGSEELQIAPGQFVSAKDVTVGYPLIAPVALSYRVFGVGVFQGRAVMASFIIAFLLVAYLFARSLLGRSLAAWSLALLATFPELYGNGKSVLGEVPGMFYLMSALLSITWLERTAYKKTVPYVVFGLATGLAVATKPIFILLPFALAITFLIRWRSVGWHWRGFMGGVVMFLATVGLWVYSQFGAGDSLISILHYYINPYDVNAGATLARNLRLFVTEAVPIYAAGMLVLWGVSIGIRKKAEESITTAEIAALVFCLCIVAAFLRLPGWYRYLFPATLTALLFLPSAATRVFDALSARARFLMNLSWVPYLGLALLCLGQLYALIGHSYVAQYYDGHRTRDLSAHLATLPKDATYFIYNSPEVVILLPGRNYYQFISPHPNQLIGEGVLPVLVSGGADFVILGTEAYHRHPELFQAYVQEGSVNRYTFLKKI